MDGDRADGAPGTPADGAGVPRRKLRKRPEWADAIPDDLDRGDQLEVVARMQFRGWAIAYERALTEVGLKITQRMALMAQASQGMVATLDKRRVWLAEQTIRGNDRVIAEVQRGRELEARDHAKGADGTQQASGPTARRGRPRKR